MYGGFRAAWPSGGTGSSAPKDRTSADKVRDYQSALDYLGEKYDRPLKYATRLRRVQRDNDRERRKETRGIAVVHHGTPIVVWRQDGMTEFLAYDSVTTRQRLNSYLPISIYRERGQLSAYIGYYTDGRNPRTLRDIRKCRQCKGHGKVGESYCYGCRYSYWPHRDNSQCHRSDRHNGHYFGTRTKPCEDCRGLGSRDYGNRPIGFALNHGSWYLLAPDGRIAGHLPERSRDRWNFAKPPPKPVKVQNVRGEILAYRGWRVEHDGTIRPLGVDTPAYDTFNLPPARCLHENELRIGRHNEPAPAPGCTCGYWAMKRPEDVPESAEVYGAVRLWGRYSEHKIGYRAQHMAIDYLVIPPPGLTNLSAYPQTIAARYPDVPVYVSDWPPPIPVPELLPVTADSAQGDDNASHESHGEPTE